MKCYEKETPMILFKLQTKEKIVCKVVTCLNFNVKVVKPL